MKRSYNYVALAIGGVLLIMAALVGLNTMVFYRTSAVGIARVARLNTGNHHPQIEFDATNGQHYRLPASSWQAVEIGQKLRIRYSADAPRASVVIDSIIDIWIWFFFLLFLAAMFLIGGVRDLRFERVSIR
ncbi:hypothetical protein GXB81_09120 [Paraburkholderia sp. Ac-20336]|uniref:DUF3592 domain-containing protein n=1 Tax=Paraburkholderia sp. Ac-20336 TaxID=2703886 RepID=UPI0019813249|nr:DUF3592 domain-containing protein [Paraburkholderia sp. Ac-20336]MBN3803214.1 hypothetical protein [Paraburkholderia sp. Ac-20336]